MAKSLFNRITDSVKKATKKSKSKKSTAKKTTKKSTKKPKRKTKKRKYHLSDEGYVKRYRNSLSQLIQEANNRMYAISNSGLISKAIFDINSSGNIQDTLFTIPENISRNDFVELKFKVRTFLNDPTSTIEGAEKFTEENYETYFVNNHSLRKEGDIETTWRPGLFVNQDFARAAYSAYRSAIEDAQIASYSQYDSESLILYTFSYMDKHGITSIENDDDRGRIIEALRNYAERHDLERKQEIENLTKGKTPDTLGNSHLFRKR